MGKGKGKGKGTINAADLLGGTSDWSFGPSVSVSGECIRCEDFR